MTISLRNYRGPEDIQLQNAFWVQVARDLPWSWKPTISPLLYSQGAQFDARSRCFAFEEGRLIGYMSFTGQAEFVSLGYPWVAACLERVTRILLWTLQRTDDTFAMCKGRGG
jgi:hypothetical protein